MCYVHTHVCISAQVLVSAVSVFSIPPFFGQIFECHEPSVVIVGK